MNLRFENKVAIITGAGIGIGFEIARSLALEGAHIILNDIDGDVVEKAAKTIREEGGQCLAVAGDSSELATIHDLVNKAVETFGHLDIAVANAGLSTFGGFLEYEFSSFQRLIAVNLQGSFFLAQAAAKQMIRQESGGRILFMSSVTGHQVHPNLAAYGMTKSGIEMLAKSLGVELGPHKITVNAIAPGATLTERTMEDAEYKKVWDGLSPTGRASNPTDIAHAALFLVSPAASQITSQALVVDGGWSAMSPPPDL
ncbi:MAG: SDR family oxidoreductase [Cyclobacteriaceae bacterium]|nr:SDR family oxidoreductase [Cyclobacteriaceae bacterium]